MASPTVGQILTAWATKSKRRPLQKPRPVIVPGVQAFARPGEGRHRAPEADTEPGR